MKSTKKKRTEIAFLGSGNMSEAIIEGILDAGLFKASALLAADTSSERLEILQARYGIRTTLSNREAVREASLVFLGVKPGVVEDVLAEIKSELGDKTLVSIAAGVPLQRLAAGLMREARIIRAMPNAPAQVQRGATVLAPGKGVGKKIIKQVMGLFEAVGKTWILDEQHLDAVTGLSGSGPAFVFMVIEAMADGGVKAGLPRQVALSLAAQTVLGAAQMVLETGDHPAQLKDFVASPAGTTISGLHQLEKGKIRAAFIAAVEAATQRAKDLGKE